MLKNLPVQLIIAILSAFFLSTFLNFETIRIFYTLSCILKEILIGILPLVIFSYITAAILSMERTAPFLIFSILVLVTLSNAFTALVSYGIGLNLLSLITLNGTSSFPEIHDTLTPLFSLHLPEILAPDRTMLLGIAVGLFFTFIKVPQVTTWAQNMRHYVTVFLQKAFIPFLPVYVFGFILEMEYEGTLSSLIKNSGHIFGLLCFVIISYLSLLYFIVSGFRVRRFLELVRNMIPAGITGFSTMSSAATMPVTLAATEKNMGDEQFADLVIPTTVNIHLMGDAIAIPIMALAVLNLSGMPLPTLENYLLFTLYFCLAKFSVAGIPGGGIIVMIPILQKYLGLTPEMASLMTTIYIIQDPIFTSANVMGNGAFALLVRKITGPKFPSKQTQEELQKKIEGAI
ncbi:MAG: dicarboxylate/amino acid:cation symporter [Alphaproteobacteria bacterium]|nr:dicarboxylate/amino acid:cation symporter [Alphaproteobacteria bacterium]